MSRIPTTEYMKKIRDMCEDLIDNVRDDVEKTKDPAKRIQKGVGMLYTSKSVGVYFHPEKQSAAFDDTFKEITTDERRYLLQGLRKSASNVSTTLVDHSDPDWVKVAYSPAIRRAGELLNFFPGEYVSGMENSPGPLQSMLTSGVVGAGLGYGAGYLGEKLLPRDWRKGKLRRTLAVLGGGLGAAPGLTWGLTNNSIDKDFNDPSLLGGDPVANIKEANDSVDIPLGTRYMTAIESFKVAWRSGEDAYTKSASAGSYLRPDGPAAVNINSLGQVLWQVGASPQDAAMTMGAMHAAQQMPGGVRPGWVTPRQVAGLAANMGGGYLSGALVGTALGRLTGLPQSAQNTLKRTGMYLGIVNSVVPKLFGR